jgi:hypothetical protein
MFLGGELLLCTNWVLIENIFKGLSRKINANLGHLSYRKQVRSSMKRMIRENRVAMCHFGKGCGWENWSYPDDVGTIVDKR